MSDKTKNIIMVILLVMVVMMLPTLIHQVLLIYNLFHDPVIEGLLNWAHIVGIAAFIHKRIG